MEKLNRTSRTDLSRKSLSSIFLGHPVENQYFRSVMSEILTKRAAILEKYASLRAQHPALLEVLRDFHVCPMMTLVSGNPMKITLSTFVNSDRYSGWRT